MSMSKKSIALAVGGAFALTLGAASIAATSNPFEIKTLSSGYQVADNHAEKGVDGKCGEGKCGAEKAKKMKDGKCGAEKVKDGKCGEGKCGAEKAKEGSCGK
ncbi:MAG: putative low-complexity protein [Methylophilaceae bacterium]|jgi:uncharacterized low-complexity protein